MNRIRHLLTVGIFVLCGALVTRAALERPGRVPDCEEQVLERLQEAFERELRRPGGGLELLPRIPRWTL